MSCLGVMSLNKKSMVRREVPLKDWLLVLSQGLLEALCEEKYDQRERGLVVVLCVQRPVSPYAAETGSLVSRGGESSIGLTSNFDELRGIVTLSRESVTQESNWPNAFSMRSRVRSACSLRANSCA